MWFGLLSLVGCSPVSAALDAEPFGVAIRTMLSEGHHPFLTNHDLNAAHDTLTSLYEQRRYQPLWVPEGRPSRQAMSTLQALRAAAHDGLRADDYEANKIIYELTDSLTDAGADASRWAQIDLALSAVAPECDQSQNSYDAFTKNRLPSRSYVNGSVFWSIGSV